MPAIRGLFGLRINRRAMAAVMTIAEAKKDLAGSSQKVVEITIRG